MRILVACEESGIVTAAFRARGYEAWSCDIMPTSGGHPEWHIQGDVLPLLREQWDMMIAFPPCTYLSQAGDVHLYAGGTLNAERYEHLKKARIFFLTLLNANVPMVAIENPMPTKIAELPFRAQVINPWEFGDPVKKRTYLWLKNLPPLLPLCGPGIVKPTHKWVDAGSARKNGPLPAIHRSQKMRSKTFPGIAEAMATQWTRLDAIRAAQEGAA